MRTPREVDVSVIVPVKDDEERLAHCLRALSAQATSRTVEVLVVDNGSASPPRATVAEHPNASLVLEPRGGSYRARNAGAAIARGTVLAFTDSDCRPASDWLEAGIGCLNAHRGPCFVAGAVMVYPHQESRPNTVERWEMLHAFPQRRYVERLHFGVTANVLIRRDDFRRVGPFDATLTSSGDREWGQRAYASGVTPVFSGEAIVHHPARRSLQQVRKKLRRVGEGAVALADAGLSGSGRTSSLLVSAARPPARTVLRNAVQLGRRDGPRYAALALALHYMQLFEIGRAAVRRR